jgi:hypothetical protein
MSRGILALSTAALLFASTGVAFANETGSVGGMIGGAAIGAAAGGPVGAVVGGAVVGNAITGPRYYHHHRYGYYHAVIITITATNSRAGAPSTRCRIRCASPTSAGVTLG